MLICICIMYANNCRCGGTKALLMNCLKNLDWHSHVQDIQPLKVVHLGGDEFPGGALDRSPACKRLLADRPEWRNRLKLYFMLRAVRVASRLGLQAQAWEDGLLERNNILYEWNETSVFINAWNNNGDYRRGHIAYEYANKGYQVIGSFDHRYSY
jgi:N-acetyl-beta-hexosaminidase